MADSWLADLEAAKQVASETLQLIQVRGRLRRSRHCRRSAACAPSSVLASSQPLLRPVCPQERNLKHPEGGPEASRLTAAARRKLGTLGGLLDGLRTSLEAPEHAGL